MKAQPEPIVSGKYFFPNAPLLCLNRMPASAVTSVNSIAPLGRGGVGLAEGDGDAVATSFVCDGAVACGCCLQETIRISKKRLSMIRGRIEFIKKLTAAYTDLRRDSHQISMMFAVGPTTNSA